MPTKYHRERLFPVLDAPRSVHPLKRLLESAAPGRRLTVVYLGLLLVACAMMFAHQKGAAGFVRHSQPLHATGEIAAKVPSGSDDSPATFLIQFRTNSGQEIQASVVPEQEAWERLHVGDRIGIVYRQNWSGTRTQVIETGLFALPAPEAVDSGIPPAASADY